VLLEIIEKVLCMARQPRLKDGPRRVKFVPVKGDRWRREGTNNSSQTIHGRGKKKEFKYHVTCLRVV
jgi:hypothetical protein